MKVTCLWIIVVSFSLCNAWDDESKLKLAITETGATQIKNDSLPYIVFQLMNSTIPDVTGTDDITLCNVKYEFTQIHFKHLDIPGNDTVTFLVQNQSCSVPLSNIDALVGLKWHYTCGLASGSGHADIKLLLNIDDTITVVNEGGIPQLQLYTIDVDITHMTIKVEGDAGVLLQWLLDTFHDRVRKALESDLENEFKQVIIPQINTYLMNTDYRVEMTHGVKMDAFLDKNPLFDSNFVEFSSQATFEEPGRGAVTCPSTLVLPIELRKTDNPLFGFVSQYYINCLSQSLYHVDYFQINITNKDIPSKSPVHLYTNDSLIDSFVPQLNQVYPNREMMLSVVAKDPPTVSLSPQNVTVHGNILLEFMVLEPEEEVNAFSLELDTESVAEVYLKGAVVSGKIMDVKHNLSIESSTVGELNVTDVDNLMSFVISFMLEPTINAYLKEGAAIPTIGPLTILEADLFLGDEFFEVQVEQFLWMLTNTTSATPEEEYFPIQIV